MRRQHHAVTTVTGRNQGKVAAFTALLLVVVILALTACDAITVASQPTRPAPTLGSTATQAALPLGCPDPSQPAMRTGASITVQPDHGSVGTQARVLARGLQPGCHLWLAMTVAPVLGETNGTPIPRPGIADEALQWVTVSDAGTVDATICVCDIMLTYAIGYPPYTSVTPVGTPGHGNVGYYHPNPEDYFFLSIAGSDIPDPPPIFARFSVTG